MRSLIVAAALVLALPAAAAPSAAPRSFAVEVHGAGPAVILIPGLACNGDVWKATVARYQNDHQLHVLTLAGFGGNKAIDGPLLGTVRSELADYIRAHKLAHPVIVGHSLGGFLALWLAETEPDLVGSIVIVDALPFLPAMQQPTATAATVQPQAAMMRTMIGGSTPEAFAAQNRAALAGMVTRPADIEPLAVMGRHSDPHAVATAIYELMTTDLRPGLAKVRAPVLVLAAGDSDQAGPLFSREYKPLPHGRVEVVDHTRHFIFVDDPTRFYRALDPALGRPVQK